MKLHYRIAGAVNGGRLIRYVPTRQSINLSFVFQPLRLPLLGHGEIQKIVGRATTVVLSFDESNYWLPRWGRICLGLGDYGRCSLWSVRRAELAARLTFSFPMLPFQNSVLSFWSFSKPKSFLTFISKVR